MDDDLHYLSATEALRMYRAHELSPVELVQAVIDRAEKGELIVNAFAATHYERALSQAREAEARCAGKGERSRGSTPRNGGPAL